MLDATFSRGPHRQPATLETLKQEHEQLDARLKKLEKLRSLSPEEQYERMVIKKRKLALKDRIRHMG